MTDIEDAVRAIYVQVAAPQWAAPNLDALSDVLRDLSWLPPGEVGVSVPPGAPAAIARVVARAAAESAGSRRPVRLRLPDAGG